MSKPTNNTATANLRATVRGGLRTGRAAPAPAPVTVWAGNGPTSLPRTLDGIAPVQHPEPSNVDPTVAKCAAVRAQVAARAMAQVKRNITARANKLRALGSATWPSFEEFVALYGVAPANPAADCADYLSVCPLPGNPPCVATHGPANACPACDLVGNTHSNKPKAKVRKAFVHISDMRYTASHRKAPRGRGLWLFERKEGAPVFEFNGLYSAAKAAATEWAREQGLGQFDTSANISVTLYVCP